MGENVVSLALVQPWELLGSLTPVIDCDGRGQGHPNSELVQRLLSVSRQGEVAVDF